MKIHLHEAHSFCQLGQRANQEDARWPDTDAPDTAQRFFVVCDGVGGNEKGEVASTKDVRAGDFFLLCSDGVLHGFSDSEIVELLDEDSGTEAKVRKLADGCASSPDNNTAILVAVESVEADDVANGSAAKGRQTTPLTHPQYTTVDVAAEKRPDKGLWSRTREIL